MFKRILLTAAMVGTLLDFGVSAAHAGRVRGPGSDEELIRPRSEVVYEDEFRADELAVVTIDGDGDTDLDLFVYDEFGNLIASDTDLTDYCVVRFRPRWTGEFKIVVKNLGRISNLYTLETN